MAVGVLLPPRSLIRTRTRNRHVFLTENLKWRKHRFSYTSMHDVALTTGSALVSLSFFFSLFSAAAARENPLFSTKFGSRYGNGLVALVTSIPDGKETGR